MEVINEKICPLCLKGNKCMAHSKEPCWCKNIVIPNELLEIVPEEKKRKACICLNCINEFKKNPTEFLKKYIKP